MRQIYFIEEAKKTLEQLETDSQLKLMTFLSNYDFAGIDTSDIIKRGSKIYYRLCFNDLRIYCEFINEEQISVCYLLTKHTLDDFLFRTNLGSDKKSSENR